MDWLTIVNFVAWTVVVVCATAICIRLSDLRNARRRVRRAERDFGEAIESHDVLRWQGDSYVLQPGAWRHFKGGLYLVFGYGGDANIEGRTVVHYAPMRPAAHNGHHRSLYSRTAASDDSGVAAWWDRVHEDGTKCLHCTDDEGCSGSAPRYEYVGPRLHRPDGR